MELGAEVRQGGRPAAELLCDGPGLQAPQPDADSRCGFAQMHIFPYSVRPGTPAAKMRQVPKAVKEERARQAAAVAEELHRNYLAACVGAVYPVLFEQPKDGRYFGHAPNYMEVLADGTDLHNQVRNVKVTGTDGASLLGELLED